MTAAPPATTHRRSEATREGSRAPLLVVAIPTALALLAAMRFPLTASPGAAGAQLLALIGGLSIAFALAMRAARRGRGGFADDLRWGAVAISVVFGAWTFASLVSEWLRPGCGASKGIGPLVILAVPVLLVQGALGAWVGRLAGSTRRALIAIAIVELLAALALTVEFYRAPQWRIASHLFVMLSTEQLWGSAAPSGVEGFRAATALFALALGAFGIAAFPAAGVPHRPRRVWLVAACLLTTGLVLDRIARREVAPTRAELRAAYSLVKTRGPLVLHADPLEFRVADLDLLLAEGTLWLDRIAVRLGQRPREPIDVYVHATADAKDRWTGARRADFALPWRHEVHLRFAGVPHPTLGHELVHVIAGEPLQTLFRTPGRWIVGVRPALIEGLAVAVTPELKRTGTLTVLESSAALQRFGRTPDARSLFSGLTFLGESHQGAYAAAGAALGEVARTSRDPAATLRAVYASGSIDGALGSSDAATAFFRGYTRLLDTLALPDGALAEVAEELSEPSTLRAVCRDTAPDQARTPRILARNGDMAGALAALGPRPSFATLLDLEVDARAVADTPGFGALARATAAIDDSLTVAARLLVAGDLVWIADGARQGAAVRFWTTVPSRSATPARARALAARVLLARAADGARPASRVAHAALTMLLRGNVMLSAPEALALARSLDAADARTRPGTRGADSTLSLARYLLARRHVLVGRSDAAAPLLARLLGEGALPTVFLEEATLMHVRALGATGQVGDAITLLERARPAATRRSYALALDDLLDRARRAALAPVRPRVVNATSDPAWADARLLGERPEP